MSNEGQKTVKEVSEQFKRIVRETDDASKRVERFDRELATKIRKAGQSGKEVVQHIEERTEKS